MQETNLSGGLLRQFVYFNGKRVARRDAGGAVHYYFSDHLGSSNVVTNALGAMPPEEESDFYPFGGERIVTNLLADQNYKFTGKERDTETNLDYFGARYYAFNFGRFITPDEFTGGPVDAFSPSDPLPPGPLPYALITNPQSLNKYAYTYNNPLRYTDPDGHQAEIFLLPTIPEPPTVDDIQLGLSVLGAFPGAGEVADVLNAGISWARGNKTEAAIDALAATTGPLGNISAIGLRSAKLSSKVFSEALSGGRHAGFLKNYADRSIGEISKGIESIGKQIAHHQDKIANPAEHVQDWNKLSAKEQQGLINKWQKDINRQQEQKEILEKLKQAKEAGGQ